MKLANAWTNKLFDFVNAERQNYLKTKACSKSIRYFFLSCCYMYGVWIHRSQKVVNFDNHLRAAKVELAEQQKEEKNWKVIKINGYRNYRKTTTLCPFNLRFQIGIKDQKVFRL